MRQSHARTGMQGWQGVHAGWLVDGTGGPVRRGAWICCEDGRIVSIRQEPPGNLRPEGVWNLKDFTLLPGLVDSHVHLTMSGTGDPEVRKAQLVAGYPEAGDRIDAHLRMHLATGVVGVRDGGDGAGHVLAFKSRKKPCPPVRLQSAGRAWRQAGRYGRLIGRPPAPGQDLAVAVAADAPAPDHVKIVNSGLNSLVQFAKETPPQFSLDQLQGAVAAASDRGLSVMVHANGRAPVAMAVAAGCTSVEHGFFMGRENLARMADAKTIWVPTAVTMRAYAASLAPESTEAQMARRNFDHQLEQLYEARRLGVRAVLGTDAGSLGVNHGAAFIKEMEIFMEAGWSMAEAVASGSSAAAAWGGQGYTGTLALGHSATFIAVKGPPEDLPGSLAHGVRVWIDGRLVHAPQYL